MLFKGLCDVPRLGNRTFPYTGNSVAVMVVVVVHTTSTFLSFLQVGIRLPMMASESGPARGALHRHDSFPESLS
jgi:hypothetical protein